MIRIRTARFKPMLARGGLAAVLAWSSLTLLACDGAGQDEWRPRSAQPATHTDAVEAGYVAPPRVERVDRIPGGLTLTGVGAPDARVRLGAPTGEAIMGQADGRGRWTLTVPGNERVRLFGLSMTHAGRTVQAEGYVLITPEAAVALLRAGAGAWRLAPGSASPVILAVDVDPEGGAVISGMAQPGAGLGVRVDRTPRAVGQAGDDGRFFLSLSEPLRAGAHDIQVSGEGGEQKITVTISNAGAFETGPFRAQRIEMGWRVDWLTPGGGVQTSLILQAPIR
jgi:hypothetical protein